MWSNTNGHKVVHRRKGKSVHTCIMYVYGRSMCLCILAVMDGWMGGRGGRVAVCVSPCPLPFFSLICILSSATLAASGVRWAGGAAGVVTSSAALVLVGPAVIGRPISLSYLPLPCSVRIKSCTPAYAALTACRHGWIQTYCSCHSCS